MKQLSEHAQVAKRIREYCKSLGVKCSARSKSYSGGDSVHWSVENIHPDIAQQIKEFASQHEYGSFNGMDDIYEYTNCRDDIPQTKYCMGDVFFTEEYEQLAYDWLNAQYPGNAAKLPASFTEAQELNWFSGEKDYNHDQMVRRQVYQVLTGDDLRQENWRDFWNALEASKPAEKEQPASVDSVTVREGTKPGYSEVLFPSKPSSDVREKLKANGFRWSRYNGVWYGKTEKLPEFVQS